MRSQPEKSEALTAATGRASSEVTQAIKQGFNMPNSTEVSSHRAITVPFHGAELYVVEHNGQPYTPMKPIVEGIGLDWGGQHKKVAANESRWGISVMEIPSAGGAQSATCIMLRKLPAWLATIDAGRVKNLEVRARVIQYQNECDDVLWQYWNEGIVVNPRVAYSVNSGDTLTKEEADTLRQMVEGFAKKLTSDPKVQGKFIMQAWSKLKTHFKVSYREIPRHELTEAISIVNRHTVDWEVVDEEPKARMSLDDSVRLDRAFHMAAQAAAHVQREVFKCVMESKKPESLASQWMLYFHQKSWGDQAVDAYCRPLPIDAICLSPDAYMDNLERGDGYVLSTEQVTRMAEFSIKNLSCRMRQQASTSQAIAH